MITARFFHAPIRLAMSLAVCFSATVAAWAQTEAPPEKLDAQQLVVGDWYEVSTKSIPEGDEPGELIHGVLVKKTDDWLVLGTVTTHTGECFKYWIFNYAFAKLDGESFVMDHPLIARFLFCSLFTQEVVDYSKNYYWIPRTPANKVTLHTAAPPATKDDLRNADPSLTQIPESFSNCVVSIEGEKITRTNASSFRFEDGQLTVMGQEGRVRDVPDPVLGKLPIIGGYFYTTIVRTRDYVAGKIPLANVSYIRQSTHFKTVIRTPAKQAIGDGPFHSIDE